MTDPAPSLGERMAQAARELQRQIDPQATMDSAVDLAVRNVPGAAHAGLSLVRPKSKGKIETVAYTDKVVVECDELQNDLDQGPCHDAIWQHRVVHSPDLRTDDRWRQWGWQVADGMGFNSMLCLRLFTEDDRVGGLNLYGRERDAFDADAREDAVALAAHIAVAVAGAQKISQLQDGIDTRALIGQAVGILMERHDLDADAAFQVLVNVSSRTHRKLRSVVEEFLATRRLPDLEN